MTNAATQIVDAIATHPLGQGYVVIASLAIVLLLFAGIFLFNCLIKIKGGEIMQRLDVNDLLKRLIKVAESSNISVLFRRNKSQCIHLENDDAIVIVNKDNKPLTQALVLSHEIGHALSVEKERELEGMQEGIQLLEGEEQAWLVAEGILREICGNSMPLKEFLMIKHACLTSYYKKVEVEERGEVA
jgi:hypothetical protein